MMGIGFDYCFDFTDFLSPIAANLSVNLVVLEHHMVAGTNLHSLGRSQRVAAEIVGIIRPVLQVKTILCEREDCRTALNVDTVRNNLAAFYKI